MHLFPLGAPLSMNVSSQGKPTSLLLSWGAAQSAGLGRALRLTCLSPLGSLEGQQLRACTNDSSFEFQGLVPGSHYQLQVTTCDPVGRMSLLPSGPAVVQSLRTGRGAKPRAEAGGGQGQGN